MRAMYFDIDFVDSYFIIIYKLNTCSLIRNVRYAKRVTSRRVISRKSLDDR